MKSREFCGRHYLTGSNFAMFGMVLKVPDQLSQFGRDDGRARSRGRSHNFIQMGAGIFDRTVQTCQVLC